MKAYIATTGTVFGLITLAHILRAIEEGRHVAADPWFIVLTLTTAALSFWAIKLLSRRPKAAL